MGVLSSTWLAGTVIAVLFVGLAYLSYSPNIPEWQGESMLLKSYCYAFRVANLLSIPLPYLTGGRIRYDDVMNVLNDLFYSHHVYENDLHVKITEAQFDGIPVKIFTPVNVEENAPGIFYIHGGGFVWFSPDSYSATTYNLAWRSNMVVVSVDYRLAPDHPYPAAFEDCLKALKYFLRRSVRFNVDPERIAVAGDSAGGNLATTILLKLTEEQAAGEETAVTLPKVKQQVLIYPCTQFVDFNTPSYQAYSSTGVLRKRDAISFFLKYVGRPELDDRWEEFAANNHTSPAFKKSPQAAYLNPDNLLQKYHIEGVQTPNTKSGNETLWNEIKHLLLDPYLSPLMAEDKALARLPPSYFIVAKNDFLHHDGLQYAKRIKNAGVEVTLEYFDTMHHGFMLLSPVSSLTFQMGLQGHLNLADYLLKTL